MVGRCRWWMLDVHPRPGLVERVKYRPGHRADRAVDAQRPYTSPGVVQIINRGSVVGTDVVVAPGHPDDVDVALASIASCQGRQCVPPAGPLARSIVSLLANTGNSLSPQIEDVGSGGGRCRHVKCLSAVWQPLICMYRTLVVRCARRLQGSWCCAHRQVTPLTSVIVSAPGSAS